MLILGSAVLAVANVGVMWAMAHRWRYAWHCNLGLQLLWLPYDAVTKQYGLLGLGAVLTVVSIKACLGRGGSATADEAVRSPRPRHRRPRRCVRAKHRAVPARTTWDRRDRFTSITRGTNAPMIERKPPYGAISQ